MPFPFSKKPKPKTGIGGSAQGSGGNLGPPGGPNNWDKAKAAAADAAKAAADAVRKAKDAIDGPPPPPTNMPQAPYTPPIQDGKERKPGKIVSYPWGWERVGQDGTVFERHLNEPETTEPKDRGGQQGPGNTTTGSGGGGGSTGGGSAGGGSAGGGSAGGGSTGVQPPGALVTPAKPNLGISASANAQSSGDIQDARAKIHPPAYTGGAAVISTEYLPNGTTVTTLANGAKVQSSFGPIDPKTGQPIVRNNQIQAATGGSSGGSKKPEDYIARSVDPTRPPDRGKSPEDYITSPVDPTKPPEPADSGGGGSAGAGMTAEQVAASQAGVTYDPKTGKPLTGAKWGQTQAGVGGVPNTPWNNAQLASWEIEQEQRRGAAKPPSQTQSFSIGGDGGSDGTSASTTPPPPPPTQDTGDPDYKAKITYASQNNSFDSSNDQRSDDGMPKGATTPEAERGSSDFGGREPTNPLEGLSPGAAQDSGSHFGGQSVD